MRRKIYERVLETYNYILRNSDKIVIPFSNFFFSFAAPNIILLTINGNFMEIVFLNEKKREREKNIFFE